MSEAIRADNLRKSYGSTVALDGVSFSVQTGTIFSLLGPNGSGKTTTIEILEGYRRRDSGTAAVLGSDPASGGHTLKRQMGLMLQDGGVYPGLKVGEAIRLFAAYYPKPKDPEALLARFDLTRLKDRKFRQLSGGEKQRLSLALALIGDPKVLFLDEPTSGMDPRMRSATWECLEEARQEGVTIMLTSHLLEEVERLSDHVAVLDSGRIVAAGSVAELRKQDEGFEFETSTPIDLESFSRFIGHGNVTAATPTRYVVSETPDADRMAQITAWLAEQGTLITSMKTGVGSLESIYLEVTRPDRPAHR